MRKSDFIAFTSTDYQDRVKQKLGDTSLKTNIGWGNGYVLVPKKCSLYEKSYIEIETKVNLPYAIDFSGMLEPDVKINIIKGSGKGKEYLLDEYWCFGFSTGNSNATESQVTDATLSLREQLIDICRKLGDNIIKY